VPGATVATLYYMNNHFWQLISGFYRHITAQIRRLHGIPWGNAVFAKVGLKKIEHPIKYHLNHCN
jgi:hypothetical protein